MKGGSFTPRLGTQIVGIIDLLACFLSIWTVKKFGRVTLVIWGHLLIAGAHFGVGFSAMNDSNTGVLLFVLLFLVIYQNSSGPIAWLYAAETTIDAALGICIFTLWGTVFILSIVSPILMKDENLGEQGTFFLFAGLSILGSLYCKTILIETKGLSDKDKKELFYPEHAKKKDLLDVKSSVGDATMRYV